MAIDGHEWPCVAMHGHVWPCMAMDGHEWPWMAMNGPIWPCMAIYDIKWENSENPNFLKSLKSHSKSETSHKMKKKSKIKIS